MAATLLINFEVYGVVTLITVEQISATYSSCTAETLCALITSSHFSLSLTPGHYHSTNTLLMSVTILVNFI